MRMVKGAKAPSKATVKRGFGTLMSGLKAGRRKRPLAGKFGGSKGPTGGKTTGRKTPVGRKKKAGGGKSRTGGFAAMRKAMGFAGKPLFKKFGTPKR